MSEKTVYVCDGCKTQIDQRAEFPGQSGVFYYSEFSMHHIGKGGHLCADCKQVMDNLIDAGFILKTIEFLSGPDLHARLRGVP